MLRTSRTQLTLPPLCCDEAMATHFVFCPRCREQKQVQAVNGQKSVACPACRLPLLVERPVAPLESPEIKVSANQPIVQNPPQPQVPFPERMAAGGRRSASWTIKIMIGSILILTLAAFSLGAFVLARKYSTPDVASQPATPPLNSGGASAGPLPGTSGTSDTRTPAGSVTPNEAPGGMPEPAAPTGTSPPPCLNGKQCFTTRDSGKPRSRPRCTEAGGRKSGPSGCRTGEGQSRLR